MRKINLVSSLVIISIVFVLTAVLLIPRLPAALNLFGSHQQQNQFHVPRCEAMRPVLTFNHITYIPAPPLEAAHSFSSTDLGPVLGKVGSGATDVLDPCGLLTPGQQVYSLKSYRVTFRLAAQGPNGVSFFDVLENPQAKNGSDLLDLAGKVAFLTTGDYSHPETVLTTIRDPQKIQYITNTVLAAPIVSCSTLGTDGQNTGEALLFHLQDGSVVEASSLTNRTTKTALFFWQGSQCLGLPATFELDLSH